MSTMRALLVAGLATMAQAFTQPKAATWGALLTPDLTNPVTQGQTFQVTWDPTGHSTDGVTVSLVLCKGPSTNCVTQSTAIVEGIPAAQKSYSWAVPCSLAAGVQATETGYGMLIIVDGTGEFQYSTQFSVLANPTCSASSSSTLSSSATTAPVSSSSTTTVITTTQSLKDSTSTHNPSNTWEYWSSSSSSLSSSISSAAYKNATSTLVTSTASSASTYKITTHAPVPTSALASASYTTSVQQFTGAAPQATAGAIGAFAAAALAMMAL